MSRMRPPLFDPPPAEKQEPEKPEQAEPVKPDYDDDENHRQPAD